MSNFPQESLNGSFSFLSSSSSDSIDFSDNLCFQKSSQKLLNAQDGDKQNTFSYLSKNQTQNDIIELSDDEKSPTEAIQPSIAGKSKDCGISFANFIFIPLVIDLTNSIMLLSSSDGSDSEKHDELPVVCPDPSQNAQCDRTVNLSQNGMILNLSEDESPMEGSPIHKSTSQQSNQSEKKSFRSSKDSFFDSSLESGFSDDSILNYMAKRRRTETSDANDIATDTANDDGKVHFSISSVSISSDEEMNQPPQQLPQQQNTEYVCLLLSHRIAHQPTRKSL